MYALAAVLLEVGLRGPTNVGAVESGVALTPDRATYLVNKDVGADRWTIALNAVPGENARFVNVTGNVFRSDGGPPAFVVCQPNVDSLGSLDDLDSVFSFTCRGADACTTSAKRCAANGWGLIADDVRLAAAFFLPAGGRGAVSEVSATPDACPGPTCLAMRLAKATGRSARRPAKLAADTPVAETDRGETLSYDQFAYLVNSDLGNERWSIALNVVPVVIESGTAVRIQSVTGNVFKRDGSPPSFVYCTEREDSQGSLEMPESQFRFVCSGASACTGTAADCAQQGWSLISDDVAIPASYFLPPDGLPAVAGSDPEIFVIGRTSDPAAIATKDYVLLEGAASASDTVAGACPSGSPCVASRIGACENSVRGTVADIAGFGCACQLDDVPTACIACGSGASGACGGGCEFPVGGATARGECLFAESGSGECACFAVPAGGEQTVAGCSGPLDAVCEAGRCCADDPRDGCSLEGGDVSCAGTCVPSDCAPGEPCGICLAGQQGSVCGDGKRDGLEQCDGDDVPSDCTTLGRSGGSLRCDGGCRYDLSRCGPGPTGSPIVSPTPTPTEDPTPTPTGPTPSGGTPTPTAIVTPSPTPSHTPTPSPTPTRTPTPGPTASPGPTPSPQGQPCPYSVDSSEASEVDVIVNVGAESGTLTLTYEPFGDPMGGGDAFSVETLEGQVLFSSGCVFDPDSNSFYPPLQDSFGFTGGPDLRLRVTTFCNGGAGVNLWTVNLSCG